jgi:hypothetical protein
MKNVHLAHPLDLDSASEELDLFAEEVQGSQQHELPPNSLSSLACECELSTFFCYGCGKEDVVAGETAPAAIPVDDSIQGLEQALQWAREKMDADDGQDQVAQVLRTVFGFRRNA